MCRIVPEHKSLAHKRPDLVDEWDFDRNGDLTPWNVSYGSAFEVGWVCGKIKEHKWNAAIRSRYLGQRCLYCSGHKVCKDNCLATKNPKLSKEWHPTKNRKLTPYDVTSVSIRKVWWQCRKGHEWSATINSRNEGNGCPCCANRRVCKDNCLAILYPQIAKEWHPTKNGKLTPWDVTYSCTKKVWWQCNYDHEWQATIANRTILRVDKNVKYKKGCPYCSCQKIDIGNCLATRFPKLMEEWDYEKNKEIGLDPYAIGSGTHKKAHWICHKCQEKWITAITHRTRKGTSCPYCASVKISSKNNLQFIFPELAKEWDYKKNELTPNQVFPYSENKFFWICSICDNGWLASAGHRSGGQGCPKCSKVILKNNVVCDSIVEAYFYLMYNKQKLKFKHNGCYGGVMGKKRYDFYFSDTNTYVEITSFNKNHKIYSKYLKKIKKKKDYVKNVLGANFKFIRTDLSYSQYRYVRANIVTKNK
jgi:hypothetical protein